MRLLSPTPPFLFIFKREDVEVIAIQCDMCYYFGCVYTCSFCGPAYTVHHLAGMSDLATGLVQIGATTDGELIREN